ncbi:MAG: CotH kinase family protein, partial [Treponemataceae bacterium]|nr:CotH kinase family protein [Treponemataceae bacterium]
MVGNKHTSKIIIALMAVAVVLCFLAIGFSDKLTELLGGTGVTMEYESKLFDTDEIISIDIQMDSDEWEKMLSNALSEEYYACDVVINGKKIKNVAIRPKGNTSLSSIAMDPDTKRYSFKLEFDHYVEGQTCYRLDKLILNNNYADATNMKEALIYDMFQYIGADSSLYNYAKISVNGEYWGVYLALEGVEQSFLLRNFGTQDGELYKPDSMEMGGGKGGSSGTPSGSSGAGGFPSPPDMSNMP